MEYSMLIGILCRHLVEFIALHYQQKFHPSDAAKSVAVATTTGFTPNRFDWNKFSRPDANFPDRTGSPRH